MSRRVALRSEFRDARTSEDEEFILTAHVFRQQTTIKRMHFYLSQSYVSVLYIYPFCLSLAFDAQAMKVKRDIKCIRADDDDFYIVLSTLIAELQLI